MSLLDRRNIIYGHLFNGCYKKEFISCESSLSLYFRLESHIHNIISFENGLEYIVEFTPYSVINDNFIFADEAADGNGLKLVYEYNNSNPIVKIGDTWTRVSSVNFVNNQPCSVSMLINNGIVTFRKDGVDIHSGTISPDTIGKAVLFGGHGVAANRNLRARITKIIVKRISDGVIVNELIPVINYQEFTTPFYDIVGDQLFYPSIPQYPLLKG